MGAAYRLALFFFGYQVKNLIDSLVWNDGFVFLFHHVFCLIVCYGALSVGLALSYGPFYLGFSEVSTAVLCVLANYDDEHGVPGLSEAFPMTKMFFGGLFAVCFLIFRVFLWPFFTYLFVKDCMLALKGESVRAKERKLWVRIFMGSNSFLSALQVLWLGQIVWMGMEEYKKIML